MSFKDFQDCKALLDMLDDDDYVIKYKYHLETTFSNMIDWFLKAKLGINSRPLPAYASNNRKVSLLDLYMAVKREGGHRRITENGIWAMIARDIGFEYDDGEYMRLIYAMYLDVLVYYYKYKTTQEKALEKEEVKMVVDPRLSRSEEDRMAATDADQTETEGSSRSAKDASKDVEHYAFFTGNDWHGIKKLNIRRRFDLTGQKLS
ncbi:putative transcription factor & chromatin remodeling ARID family [Helianthus anomalus]